MAANVAAKQQREAMTKVEAQMTNEIQRAKPQAGATRPLGIWTWTFIGYWGLGIGHSPTERR